MRDVTTRRTEYDQLLARLVDLWRDPAVLDRREVDHVCTRLRELLREDGVGRSNASGRAST